MRGDRTGARSRMDCSWRRSPPATSGSACSFASPTAARSARRTRSSSGRSRTRRAVGPEEGGADRAADGREHRQGHVRGARRRVHRDGRDEGRRGALRPHAPAPLPARRAGPDSQSPGRPGRSSRGASRGACGASTRARSSTPATTASGRSPRSRRPPRRPSSGCARPATSWPARRASSSGYSDVDRGSVSARRRMREAADAARIGRSLAGRGRRGLIREPRRLQATSSTSSSTTRRTTDTGNRSRR